MLSLSELLVSRGLKTTENTKIVRHQDKRMDVKELRRRGFFEFYQSTRARTSSGATGSSRSLVTSSAGPSSVGSTG